MRCCQARCSNGTPATTGQRYTTQTREPWRQPNTQKETQDLRRRPAKGNETDIHNDLRLKNKMTASLQYRIQGGSINDGIVRWILVFMLRSEWIVPVLSWQAILFF
jgi:hypothetical protein